MGLQINLLKEKVLRETLTCNDLMISNALVAEMCGHPTLLKKIKNKYDVNKPKRKINKRLLVRRNANKYAHEISYD